jgi:hypothetical protein
MIREEEKNMTKKIVLGLAVVALATVVTAPSVSAACIPAKSAKTYNSGTGAYTYWHSPDGDAAGGTLVGQTWQLGASGTWSTGDCAGFLYFNSANAIGLDLNLGGCGSGCPATGSTLAVLAQKKAADNRSTAFLLATVAETPGGAVNFDYSDKGALQMIQMPRPNVTSSSRVGSTVNLNVQVPAVSGGLYGPGAANAVTGYRVLSAQGATDPGRDAAAYSLRSTLTATAGGAATGTVALDCTNLADTWVVTQVVFDGGAVTSNAVSEARQVHCNPALADPKYKIVPKRGTPKQGVGSSN